MRPQGTRQGLERGVYSATRQESHTGRREGIVSLPKADPRTRSKKDQYEYLLDEIQSLWNVLQGRGDDASTRNSRMKLTQALDHYGRPTRLYYPNEGTYIESSQIQDNTDLFASYLPLAGGTLSGTLEIDAGGGPLEFISAGGWVWTWKLQDGEGRVSQYWNTEGGASPTFTEATEKASGVIMTPNSNLMFEWLHSGPSTTHSADDPITWDRIFSIFAAGGFQASLDLAETSASNIFNDTTAGNLRGGWNPYLDEMDTGETSGSYRIMASYKGPGTSANKAIVADPHSHKYFEGYIDTTDQNLSGAGNLIGWNGEANKHDIYTHSTSTNPSRIQVDRDGLYDVNVNITLEWVSTTGTLRSTYQAVLRKNGVTNYRARASNNYIRNAEGNDRSSINMSRLVPLQIGDYLEVVVSEVNTGTVTVAAKAGESEIQVIYRGNSKA